MATGKPDKGQSPRLSVSVGDKEVTDYVWDAAAHAWARTIAGVPHKTESGTQIAPTNVIVQFMQYRPSIGDTDAAKSQVFAIDVVGSGEAWALADCSPDLTLLEVRLPPAG